MHSRATLTLTIIIVVLIVVLSSSLGSCIKEASFRKHPTFDRLCSASGLTSLGLARSAVECGKRCGDMPGCVSYFYNRLDATCRGSNLVYINLTACDVIPGVVLYQPELAECLAAPPLAANAAVLPGGTLQTTVRSYKCDPGWGLSPGVDPTTTCLANGTWSPLAFTCILKTCEAGWEQLGHSCFFVEQPYQYLQIDAATTYCHGMGAYVMQLETSAENTAVRDYLGATFGANSWWVGITDDGTEGTWHWMETGEGATFLDWNNNEPDGATVENYVIMWDTVAWADVPFDAGYTPVCEKPTQVIV